MPNVDAPRGFRPYGELIHVGIYIAAGTIYPGDCVKKDAGAANTTEFRPRVAVAAAGDALVGVALNYAAAGSVVRVADSPMQLFSGQGDAADFDSNTDLNLNANILATAGSSTYKVSRQEVATATLATTATLQMQVLGYVDRHDAKNQMGEFAELIVKINNHQLSAGTGTAGV